MSLYLYYKFRGFYLINLSHIYRTKHNEINLIRTEVTNKSFNLYI